MSLRWYGAEVTARIEQAGARGVGDGLDVISEASQDRVLVETGRLKNSHQQRHEGLQGAVGYTDSKAAAAHENLAVRPKRGKRAKFLESAADDNRDAIREAVADQIRRAL